MFKNLTKYFKKISNLWTYITSIWINLQYRYVVKIGNFIVYSCVTVIHSLLLKDMNMSVSYTIRIIHKSDHTSFTKCIIIICLLIPSINKSMYKARKILQTLNMSVFAKSKNKVPIKGTFHYVCSIYSSAGFPHRKPNNWHSNHLPVKLFVDWSCRSI